MSTDEDLSEILSAELSARIKPAQVDTAVSARIKQKVMSGIRPVTQRAAEDWTEITPLARTRVLFVDQQQGCQISLLQLSAGASLDGHYHKLDEECLVLEGEFNIGDLTLKKGDFHLVRKGSFHQDAYTETGCTLYLRHEIQDDNFFTSHSGL